MLTRRSALFGARLYGDRLSTAVRFDVGRFHRSRPRCGLTYVVRTGWPCFGLIVRQKLPRVTAMRDGERRSALLWADWTTYFGRLARC